MNLHAQTRKGQSAIEYLSTYGWALLAILVVVGAIMQMGVLNPCSERTPRFTGQNARLADWAFTDTNSLSVVVEATEGVIDLNSVNVTIDNGNDHVTDVNSQISQGSTQSVSVDTASDLSSGECMTADVVLDYNTTDIDNVKATGEGKLQGQAP